MVRRASAGPGDFRKWEQDMDTASGGKGNDGQPLSTAVSPTATPRHNLAYVTLSFRTLGAKISLIIHR